ncbi:MAG: peptidoglycan-associated lipoprotein Pal [Alphaproteobacteria bacterium]
MRFKFLSLLAAALLLAACETTPQQTSATSGDGGAGARAGSGVGSSQIGRARPGSQEDLVAQVGDRVFFDFDKFDLKPEARAIVDKQAAWLKANPRVTVTIEGHADERGTREYNLALGERRANAVRSYLLALGIEANRISTVSYGKERPEVLGSNEWAWSQNRRGVMAVNG